MWFLWATDGCTEASVINSEFPSAGISLPLLRDVRSDVPLHRKVQTYSAWLALARSPQARFRTPSTSCSWQSKTDWLDPPTQGFPVTFVNDAAQFQAASGRGRAEGAAEQSAAQAHREDHHVPIASRCPHSLGIIAYRRGADCGSWPR